MPDQIKIYTKTGDKGETSLIGGKRVPKFHPRIEAYGTVDELNSFIGLLRDQEIQEKYKDVLFDIQDKLFRVESILALDPESGAEISLPEVIEDDIQLLEKQIDAMNDELPELKSFILPGGHPSVSYCHVARTICRRAERNIIRLAQSQEVNLIAIRYLNRLSDYLFVLGRKLAFELGVDENIWKPVT